MAKIGVIGGSGLDDPKLLKNFKLLDVTTKYGRPSSPITAGKLGNNEVFIISRHGKAHKITPTKVNNKANIQALKGLKVNAIISTTACGSLTEDIERGDLVILDQFIDFTRHRNITFHDDFSNGIRHTPMADPFDDKLRNTIISTAKKLKLKHHAKGTVITVEGPRFSTRAESRMFKLLGAHVINMSIAPEAILANELKIPYASIAISTDFDSWKLDESPVSWEQITKTFNKKISDVKTLLTETIRAIR
ncbi:MAG TPA: MTAP family purine nucleoside phosphorylase [Candidatus Nanoarchaeia archaeon]|nr:MTAP family purine nucleoside phosphorylase [Candidatus Nanoarchaeia archaeon]